jgi:voltage-gated potassium channel
MRTWRFDVELHTVKPLDQRLQPIFDLATLVAAILTLPVVVALGLDPPAEVESALEIVNWCLWGTFALELATMLAIAPDRRHWLRSRPITPVVVLVTVPAFAGLDLFRLVRLLRGPVARRLAEGVTSTEGLRNVALLTLTTVALGGLLFAQLEPGVGVGNGLYWAVTTVTTTGYGDIVPTTSGGKWLAVIVMLVGAGFLAILTGAIAQRFVGRWRGAGADAPTDGVPEDVVLAKLDELGERLATLERAVTRGG